MMMRLCLLWYYFLFLLALDVTTMVSGQQQQQSSNNNVHPMLERIVKFINQSGRTVDLYYFHQDSKSLSLVQPSIRTGVKLSLETSVGQQFAINEEHCRDDDFSSSSSCGEKQFFIISEHDTQVVTALMTDEEDLMTSFWDNGIQEGLDSGDSVKICRAKGKAKLHTLKFGSDAYRKANMQLLKCDLPPPAASVAAVTTKKLTSAGVDNYSVHDDDDHDSSCSLNNDGGNRSSTTTSSSHNEFGGEAFLPQGFLPNYDKERQRITVELITSLLLIWSSIYYLKYYRTQRQNSVGLEWEEEQAMLMTEQPTKKEKAKHKSSSRNGKKKTMKSPTKAGTKQPQRDTHTSFGNTGTRNNKKSSLCYSFSLLLFGVISTVMTIILILLFRSSNNHLTGRGVFEVPLLTVAETQRMHRMLQQVTARNYLKAWKGGVFYEDIQMLWEPYGWQKLRHKGYPTTDLSTLTDPFTLEDRKWMANIFDRRLGPTLARIYGIPEQSIRAHDLFVVRYDHDQQATLNRHRDSSDISFNLLLTEDFDGGGTRFWNTITNTSFAHVEPSSAGTVVIHRGQLEHEGVDVTRGIRIILVGFLHIDTANPFTTVSSGVSWYATWLDATWFAVWLRKMNEKGLQERWGKQTRLGLFMEQMGKDLDSLLDRILPMRHFVFDPEDKEGYLQGLDCAYKQRHRQDASNHISPHAMWFEGHNIFDNSTQRMKEAQFHLSATA